MAQQVKNGKTVAVRNGLGLKVSKIGKIFTAKDG